MDGACFCVYLRMIDRSSLAICSDAGRCSDVRVRQVPRVHSDFGARMYLPDPLGTSRRSHAGGLHHRRPHPELLRLRRGPNSRQRGKHALTHPRTHARNHSSKESKPHWPVLSICPSLVSPSRNAKKRKENQLLVLTVGPRRTRNGGTHHPASSSTISTFRSLPRTYIVSFCQPTPTSSTDASAAPIIPEARWILARRERSPR